MKIIVDIDAEYYEALKKANVIICGRRNGKTLESAIFNAIGNGVPLAESDDCVSRKAIYRALNKWDWQDAYLPIHFKELVEDLPPVQPAKKRETSAFVEKYKNAMQEGCYLDQGITQGIV